MDDYVVKRDGTKQTISYDKVLDRIRKVALGLSDHLNRFEIARNTISNIYNGIKTTEIDYSAARLCASRVTIHPDYDILASRLIISSHHKNTKKYGEKFSHVFKKLYENKDYDGNSNKLVDDKYYSFVMKHKDFFDNLIDYDKDFGYDFFGFMTMERGYLQRDSVTREIIERPQDMVMRSCLEACYAQYHSDEGILGNIEKLYEEAKNRNFTFATPTLFNSCSVFNQNSSCYLLSFIDDSIEGIFTTYGKIAQISKWAGGIGLSISNIRGKGSLIRKTNGKSNGLVPFLSILDKEAIAVNQGGKRNGSIAVYIEPWHVDIMSVLRAASPLTEESHRAKDLFYAIWMNDVFMKRLLKATRYSQLLEKQDKNENEVKEMNDLSEFQYWYLMDPDECPRLYETYGDEFEKLYYDYVERKKYRTRIRLLDLWNLIKKIEFETGTPYMTFKDHANRKSNHKHLGVIRNSNLCTEIYQYNDAQNFAVCNLASICLPNFVTRNSEGQPTFQHEKLFYTMQLVVRALDNIIDNNFYPTEECRRSNQRDRPIGIGVQGLHDMFIKMRIPFKSERALKLNREVFETMYYSFLNATIDLAKEKGVYNSYENSPLSQGILQFDMWDNFKGHSGRYNWEMLKTKLKCNGARNSLGIALMPTASTSQIMGNSIAMECYNGNYFVRRTLAGEFTVVNKYLLKDLIERNLWNEDLRVKLLSADYGSIQEIDEIPQTLKDLYVTTWDIGNKYIIDMAADRGPYIDQGESLNLFIKKPDPRILHNAHIYSWKKGLKTGCYYVKQGGQAKAQQFAFRNQLKKIEQDSGEVCRKEDGCIMCEG